MARSWVRGSGFGVSSGATPSTQAATILLPQSSAIVAGLDVWQLAISHGNALCEGKVPSLDRLHKGLLSTHGKQ